MKYFKLESNYYIAILLLVVVQISFVVSVIEEP